MMNDESRILFIQMGGTIDKDYPKTFGGYSFEIYEPASQRILTLLGCDYIGNFVTVCRKDSQDINQTDRENLYEILVESKCCRIIITHGTDTMLETAAFLAADQTNVSKQKIIVLTGSLKPEKFKNSDAEFNVGTAVGAVQSLNEPGIYIAMNGRILKWNSCRRDPVSGHFVPL